MKTPFYPVEISKKSRTAFKLIGAVVVVSVLFAWYSNTHTREYKKLDYSKPVFTADDAVVCPKTLLWDTRADHHSLAIFEAFTAITDREGRLMPWVVRSSKATCR